MSIAIINASVAGSLAVAGQTTLSGSLISSSSLSSQSMTTKAFNVNDIYLNGKFICNLPAQTTGTDNLILGSVMGCSLLSTGSNNVGLGYSVLDQTITGSYNTAIGFQAGGGVLGNENICIGRNSGISSSNIYNQSVCIGINSQITASNQISLGTSNEIVQIPGNMSIIGQINLSDSPLYLRNSDSNHSLQYNSGVDGPYLQGFSGGKLGTTSNTNVLKWNSQIVNINTALEMIQDTGSIRMNASPFYYGPTGDSTNFLQYNGTIGGLSLQSSVAGKLGTSNKSDIITWNSSNIGINGNMQIATTGEIRMNLAPIYLKTMGDNNHVLRYISGPFDGPSLQGFAGGTLRTLLNTAVLTWSDLSVNMNVPLISNTNIQQPTSGYFVNFYRKTNCATSETYNFQSAHGKYEIYFNANHDRNMSSFHHLDIVNNINQGSYSVSIYKGSGISVNIDANTNIMTITCAVSGGTLQINRIMMYN